MRKKVFLVGYMGVGKTTIGKKIANLLQYTFIDLDHQIEQKSGQSIADFFKNYGEGVFRKKETQALYDAQDQSVIATGGGTPIYNSNMTWMLNNGLVIYLQMDAKMLVDRLRQAKSSRPLLANKTEEELEDFIKSHLAARVPTYEKAHLTWPAKNNSATAIEKLTHQIKSALGEGSHST